ncbi:MAG: DUF485 domain-containing protein [Planctomycetota bacterium]|nr:MAG: DUF485 domain-containing protein [Planctomycetota bacterium]REJ89232.1 MAG: DUF485 domain-containing protein [Planctomycetota bacterium]REK31605.1 MAG: DUF485 domain-containing protein [Planctomycetota bacterium]REK40407.1 MAG: DUF485 domain-containing protein [Planctomycetota bacterium]
MEKRNTGLGLTLFTIYLLLYSGFVFLNAFRADLMERTPVAGVNLAVLYGFVLIIVAFVLALLYGFLARSPGDASAATGAPTRESSANAGDDA